MRVNLPLYKAIVRAGKDFAKTVGGTATTAPTWWPPRRRNVTVHALGGCTLGPTRAAGVVTCEPDRFGEVFGYQNLFVADGSIVPVSLGANPSLTIAALAEMVAHGITQQPPTGDLRHRTGSDERDDDHGTPRTVRVGLR